MVNKKFPRHLEEARNSIKEFTPFEKGVNFNENQKELYHIKRLPDLIICFRSESSIKSLPHYKLKVSQAGFRAVGNVFCRTRRNLLGCLNESV